MPLNPAAAAGHHGDAVWDGPGQTQPGDHLVGSQEGVVGPGRGGASTRTSPVTCSSARPGKVGPVAMATPPFNGYCAKPVVPYQGRVP